MGQRAAPKVRAIRENLATRHNGFFYRLPHSGICAPTSGPRDPTPGRLGAHRSRCASPPSLVASAKDSKTRETLNGGQPPHPSTSILYLHLGQVLYWPTRCPLHNLQNLALLSAHSIGRPGVTARPIQPSAPTTAPLRRKLRNQGTESGQRVERRPFVRADSSSCPV